MTADRRGPIQPEDLRRFHAALASRSTRQGRSERWLRAAIRTSTFFWIAAAFFLGPVAQMGMMQHQVPLIVEAGI